MNGQVGGSIDGELPSDYVQICCWSRSLENGELVPYLLNVPRHQLPLLCGDHAPLGSSVVTVGQPFALPIVYKYPPPAPWPMQGGPTQQPPRGDSGYVEALGVPQTGPGPMAILQDRGGGSPGSSPFQTASSPGLGGLSPCAASPVAQTSMVNEYQPPGLWPAEGNPTQQLPRGDSRYAEALGAPQTGLEPMAILQDRGGSPGSSPFRTASSPELGDQSSCAASPGGPNTPMVNEYQPPGLWLAQGGPTQQLPWNDFGYFKALGAPQTGPEPMAILQELGGGSSGLSSFRAVSPPGLGGLSSCAASPVAPNTSGGAPLPEVVAQELPIRYTPL